MAINPTQARQQAKVDPQKVKMLEDQIDEAIIETYRKGKKMTIIDNSIFPDEKIMRIVATNYRKRGWSVKARGGEYRITQKPKKSYTSYTYDPYGR